MAVSQSCAVREAPSEITESQFGSSLTTGHLRARVERVDSCHDRELAFQRLVQRLLDLEGLSDA